MKTHGRVMQKLAQQWASKNNRDVEDFWDSSEYAKLIADDDELWEKSDGYSRDRASIRDKSS